jgi:predicted RNase H-like HicB family nuclease
MLDNEVNQYIGIVPGLTGGHTQAPTLDELYSNLQEVIKLCLQEMSDEEKLELPHFIGTQNIPVAV